MSANDISLPNQISSCEASATRSVNFSQMRSGNMRFRHICQHYMVLDVRLHTVMQVLSSHVLSSLLPCPSFRLFSMHVSGSIAKPDL